MSSIGREIDGMWTSISSAWTSTTTSTTFDPESVVWAHALEPAQLEHSDVELMAHPASSCAGQWACPLHNRSVHPMRAMTQMWREDRGLIERVCEHGCAHPDPDQYEFWLVTMGKKKADAEMSHSCDGCGH